MLEELRTLAQKGLRIGFLKNLSVASATTDSSNLVFGYGPFASNLFFAFRHEWIKSFIVNNGGRYEFLWLDSIDQIKTKPNMTIGWSTKLANNNSKSSPFMMKHENQIDDDYLSIKYIEPGDTIDLKRLSDERTRFWKKYISNRERLQCTSFNVNRFNINYYLSSDIPPYNLETIQKDDDSSLQLLLNVNHTLSALLIDSKMHFLHPLLVPHQIGIKSTSLTTELSFYLSKLLSYKYHLRVVRLLDQSSLDDQIPFHIILNDDSIRTGVCFLWNRETQLAEKVHVKLVAKYLADYFKALEDFV